MEQVVDKLIAEMNAIVLTEEFLEYMDVTTEAKWDDPGLVTMDEYPYIYVAPVNETPISETLGYENVGLNIQIGVVVNAADYFDETVSELPASRELVGAASLIRKRLRRLSKRQLDGLSGVRDLDIEQTNYVPDLRENVFVRVALITLTVERQYQKEE
jgi:hypothetical protein